MRTAAPKNKIVYWSIGKVIRSAEPVRELENELVEMLAIRLKRLKIKWNPKAFVAGLNNPDLPIESLRRLDDLVSVGILLRWELPPTLVENLDTAVETVESFNPNFLSRLNGSREGDRVSSDVVRKRLAV